MPTEIQTAKAEQIAKDAIIRFECEFNRIPIEEYFRLVETMADEINSYLEMMREEASHGQM